MNQPKLSDTKDREKNIRPFNDYLLPVSRENLVLIDIEYAR